MPIRLRKFIGAILLILLVVTWALLAMALAQSPLVRANGVIEALYYVLAGRSRVRVGDEVGDVAAGSVVFVAAHVPHRFEDISEALSLLVVFGPAEGSRWSSATVARCEPRRPVAP